MNKVNALCVVTTVVLCLTTLLAMAQASGTIKPGDMVYVEVYRAPEITQTIRVDEKGNIRLAYVGTVKVSGLTEAKAATAVSKALEKIMRRPKVTLTLSQFKGEAPSVRPATGRTPDMVLEIIELNNSSAESMHAVIQGMNSPGGHVTYHPSTNSLVITDTPEALKNMRSAIKQLDGMQSQLAQVRIEAKFAEVNVGAMKEIGIRWFAQGDHLSGGSISTPRQLTQNNQVHGGIGPLANEALNSGNSSGSGSSGDGSQGRQFIDSPLVQRLNIPAQIATPGQTFIGFVNDGIDFGAMLDVLVSDDKAELLANPMTSTVNHQQARIEMIDKIPYTEFGTEITGASSFSTRFLDAGIILDVVPHVYQDEHSSYVKLDLKPEVSFASGSVNGVPILSVRRSETIANVRNGQTLIVGGILSEEERNVVSKVPVLGDLPLIGALFRHKEKAKDRTELMIFVTPTIYENPEDITWDKMLDASKYLRDSENVPIAEIRTENEGE